MSLVFLSDIKIELIIVFGLSVFYKNKMDIYVKVIDGYTSRDYLIYWLS